MLDYSEYVISESGALSYRIAVPCFIGDGADFSVAARMNSFYASALSEMYRYVENRVRSNVRRRSYTCSFEVRGEDDTYAVTLQLTERLVRRDGERSEMKRRWITHVWRDGVIIKRSVE